jgi:hypothetical protein
MCLPVSRLFWVSSLAYPNLLGTKGYVVVVVVVVVVTICRITHSPGWLGGSSTLQASGVEGGWAASLTGGSTNWVIAQFSRRQFVNHSSHVLFNQLSICLMNCSISRAILVKKCFKGC